jgi:asparagine synthase (glutamine-hydrolysing)
MSCAGLWSRAPLGRSLVEGMLRAFVPAAFHISLRGDVPARIVLGEASLEAGDAELGHDSGVSIVGDIRLDGTDELARALGTAVGEHGVRWLVAEAYQRWGTEFAARLYGDFGFALWDSARRRLLLVRDAGGSRSLFYTTRGAVVAFSSHPRALLQLPGVPTDLDERAVIDFLGEFPQDERATLHAAVMRVPPAGALVVDETGARLIEYLDVTRTPERRLPHDRDYAKALRDALARAVEARAVGRVGVMLSGGLDSSSIAALAQGRAGASPIVTISGVFPEFAECDERPYQSSLVATIGSQHHEVRPDPTSDAGDFERLCQVFSDPTFIGPHWLAWPAASVARSEGVTTLLTGIDGDRVVSHGAGRFADLARERDWQGLLKELGAVHDFDWRRRLRVFGAQALFAILPDELSARLDRLDPRRHRRFAAQRSLLRADVLARQRVGERLLDVPLRPRSSREEHARSLRAPDRNWDVELLDQLGLAFGVQFAQPFFDRRVMELCFSFPGSQKRQKGWSRYVLRNAMRGLVPDAILDRRQDASFDRPYWAWARAWLRANPSPGSLEPLAPFVEVDRVAQLLRNPPKDPDSGPVDFLWRCVILSRWLRAQGLKTESFRPPVQPT